MLDHQVVIDWLDSQISERPAAVIVAFLVVTAVFAVGLGNVSTSAGTEQFTQDVPAQQAYDHVTTELLESDDVVEAVVEYSADFDLTIVGATREGSARTARLRRRPRGGRQPLGEHRRHGEEEPRHHLAHRATVAGQCPQRSPDDADSARGAPVPPDAATSS